MKKIPINKDRYSESSKKSVGHEFLGKYYSDIKYKCSKCKKPEIFTAQEQKEAYEDRKEYMWSKHLLCKACWKEMRSIEKELEEKEEYYINNKETALKNKEFLEEWLETLQEYPKYGKKENTAKIHSISNALKRA